MIQIIEMFEVALDAVRTMRQLYARLITGEPNEERLSITQEIAYTLDYYCLLYENILLRINDLPNGWKLR